MLLLERTWFQLIPEEWMLAPFEGAEGERREDTAQWEKVGPGLGNPELRAKEPPVHKTLFSCISPPPSYWHWKKERERETEVKKKYLDLPFFLLPVCVREKTWSAKSSLQVHCQVRSPWALPHSGTVIKTQLEPDYLSSIRIFFLPLSSSSHSIRKSAGVFSLSLSLSLSISLND